MMMLTRIGLKLQPRLSPIFEEKDWLCHLVNVHSDELYCTYYVIYL